MAIYYDLLVYHDLSDPTEQLLRIGDRGDKLGFSADLQVVALGPGIHEGRRTIVLAHGPGPMQEVQSLLEAQRDR